jgi:hypothetical protein
MKNGNTIESEINSWIDGKLLEMFSRPTISLIIIYEGITSRLVMDIRITDVGTISTVLLSGLLIVVAAIGVVEPQKAVGQAEEVFNENATFAQEMEGGSPTATANQTAAPTPPTANTFTLSGETGAQNQTQMALANLTGGLVNLTRADFALVTSALDSARDSILNNSRHDAYTSLNEADNELFATALGKGSSAEMAIIEVSGLMRDHIESAQKALLIGDLPNALNERHFAEVELVRVTQGLPAGVQGPPAGEEEPPAAEEEPPADEEEPPEDEEE